MSPQHAVLDALLDRPAPLAAPDAGETVRRSADRAMRPGRGVFAHFVPIHRRVPPAAERLLAKLRGPEDDWLADDIWEKRAPREMMPALEALAREQPDRHGERVKEIWAPRTENRP